MSFFTTIKLGSLSPALLGNVQLQPKKTVKSSVSEKVSSVSSLAKTSSVLSKPAKSSINSITLDKVTGINASKGLKTIVEIAKKQTVTPSKKQTVSTQSIQIEFVKNPTVASVASGAVIPVVKTVTQISPAYEAIVKQKKVTRSVSSDNANQSAARYSSYESLTGISNSRPEIILMSEFRPLFLNSSHGFNQYAYYDRLLENGIRPTFTETGNLVDAQMNARNLAASNVIQMLRSIRDNDPEFEIVYKERNDQLFSALASVENMVGFLTNLINRMDIVKTQLDLRNVALNVKTDSVIESFSARHGKSIAANGLQQLASTHIPKTYDVTAVLERLGYKKEAVLNVFSSSKLWLQVIEEYKDIVRHHSPELIDVEPVSQRNDNNPSSINKVDSPTFRLSEKDPRNLLFLNQLVGIKPTEMLFNIGRLVNAYSTLYEPGINFKTDEAKIAALTNVLSKEFSYSVGMRSSAVKNALSEFRYNIKDTADRAGNIALFDWVLGQFSDNATVFPEPELITRSLSSLAYSRSTTDSKKAILTFETKLVQNQQGTIVPGSVYYVDEILNVQQPSIGTNNSGNLTSTQDLTFNFDNLERLSKRFQDAANGFSTVVDGMCIHGETEFKEKKSGTLVSVMKNQPLFLEKLLELFVDDKGVPLPTIRRDRLTPLFTLASQDKWLKAQLFFYYINRIARSYSSNESRSISPPVVNDNTSLTDALSRKIITDQLPRILKASTLHDLTQNLGYQTAINESTLLMVFRKGTHLSNTIESVMTMILDEFDRTKAISRESDRTLYGGHMDTMIMMVVFDLIVSIIGRYGNQTFSGKSPTTSQYFVMSTVVNNRDAINALMGKVNREKALVQQMTWYVLNTLSTLSTTTRLLVNHLQRPKSISKLNEIAQLVKGGDRLKHLLTEQQILVIASSIDSLMRNFKEAIKDDSIELIDNSRIEQRLKDAFYGFFNLPEFTSSKAFNKKILTVGLPVGFTSGLAQKVKVSEQRKTSFAQKQDDIIEILVYKIDLLNQDIVFKPLKFMFDMSRFPTRNDYAIKQVSSNPTLDEILAAVSTTDKKEGYEQGTTPILYWDEKLDTNADTMKASSYDFMSKSQKKNVVLNHITSYMCELYLKILTGISTSDSSFDLDQVDSVNLVNQDMIRTVTEYKLSEITKQSTAPKNQAQRVTGVNASSLRQTKSQDPSSTVLFGSRRKNSGQPQPSAHSGVAATSMSRSQRPEYNNDRSQNATFKRPSIEESVANMSHRDISTFSHTMSNISRFSRMYTTISDGDAIKNRIIRPKMFDRVFNIVVDPDDFAIDYNKTMETEFGRKIFQQMINSGVISAGVDINNVSYRTTYRGQVTDNIVNNFILRERDKKEGDTALEKYFIVINTFGEEAV